MNDHHPLVPAKSRRGDRRSFVLFCLFFLTLGLALEVDHRPGMRITMRAAEEREKCFFFFLLLLLLLVFFLVRATSMKAPGTQKKTKKEIKLQKNRKKEPTESRSGSVGERSVRSRLLFLFCWNFLLFYLIFDFFSFVFVLFGVPTPNPPGSSCFVFCCCCCCCCSCRNTRKSNKK